MSSKKFLGLLIAALVGVSTFASGCGGSGDNSAPADSGSEVFHRDSAPILTGDDGGADGGGMFDGTTGKACTADTDCVSANGPGINKCSSNNVFVMGPLNPTAVCLMPANCDPGSDGNVHYCDGPDLPTSPGVCLSNGTAGMGTCFPQCTAAPDGRAPTGCQGKDVCNLLISLIDTTTNAVTGVGFCLGGCTVDADCPTGSKCQPDSALCLKTVHTPTKAIGASCTQTDNVRNTCNCVLPSTATTGGYCTVSCIVGGAPCPAGYVCDAQEPSDALNPPGFTQQNPGLGGICFQQCALPGDAGAPASDASGAAVDSGGGEGGGTSTVPTTCPGTSTCVAQNVAGPDCLP
jgi:hypothetical protein